MENSGEYRFIVNPTAGSGYARQVMEQLKPLLSEKGIRWQALYTEKPGHATALARQLAAEDEVRAVIAVGGDGTLCEVAAGLTGTGKPMGIIPAGTGNDLIKTVGLPSKPEEALRFLLNHESRAVDTGRMNDTFFLNVCGTGFDVTVLDCAEEFKEKHRGLTPYLLGLIKAITHYRPVHLTITYDGKREEGDYLVCSVANGRFIGGGIPICPAAEMTDGKLDLVLIGNRKRWQIPFYLPGLMMGHDLRFKVTRHLLAEKVTLSGKDMRLNVDGTVYPMDEAVFQVMPASLKLIC